MDSIKDNNQPKRTLNKEEREILNLFDDEKKEQSTRTPSSDYQQKIKQDLNKKTKRKNSPVRLVVIAVIFIAVIIGLIVAVMNQPKISLKGNENDTVEVLTEYQDEGANATFFAFNCSKKIVTNSNLDTSKIGTYTIDYSITKAGRTKTVTRTVNVVDTTKPEIKLNGDVETTVSSYASFSEPGYTATDNYDGDLTASVQVTDNETADGHIIIYTVTDKSGNKAEVARNITVKDIVSPSISITGKATVWVEVGKEYKELGATAVDDVDGTISPDKIEISGTVNTNAPGNYTLTYTATDSSGNKANAQRVVKVMPLSSIPESERYSNNSKIYLTFDDGPGSLVTPRVLDILKQYNIKATFFICNYSEANKALVQRAVDEGHSIGIHGYTHDWTAYTSDETYINNITSLHDKLLADTGYDAKITRFLGGSSNTVSAKYSTGIMSRLAVKVEQMGYQYYDWNVSSGDAERSTVDTSIIIANVEGGLAHDRNNIVLMHDINSKTTTADALPTIIEYGLNNGYIFLPITPDVTPVHHGINN